MKTIEKLLQEYKIRFRDTELIKRDGYPFKDRYISNHPEGGYEPIVCESEVWNINGQVYGGGGKWATADLKEKPIGWVVDLDKEHPKYNDFIKWYKDKAETSKRYMFNGRYQSSHSQSDCIFDFKSGQLITLDQWADFFLPKVDFSILNDTDVFYLKTRQDEYLFTGGNPITKDVKGRIVGSYYKFENRICDKNDVIELRKATDNEKEHYYTLYPELRPPKVGDWGIFWDDEKENLSISVLSAIDDSQYTAYHYMEITETWYSNFHKIDITKNVQQQIDNFLKQAK